MSIRPPGRTPRRDPQSRLFDLAAPRDDDWRGMPAFGMADVRPHRSVTIHLRSDADYRALLEALDLRGTGKTDSLWFPPEAKLRGEYAYTGPPTPSRYPVCIPSKGRADRQLTARALDRLGVDYRVFVEAPEADAYRAALPAGRVVSMPFADLGQGSIPARNFIWDWAAARGDPRHWVMDDNIRAFVRTHENRRLRVLGGGFFAAMEDFVDRYHNVVLAGPHDKGFVPDRAATTPPFRWNRRVYSCILIDTAAPYRWRGRYNEDTDLCLRVLKDGGCTVLFNALAMDKCDTAGGRGCGMPGGNTDTVYATDDRRRAFAESLVEQHPDVARVVWKYGRWHHEVDYRPFAGNRPIRRSTGELPPEPNDYGMTLTLLDPGGAQ